MPTYEAAASGTTVRRANGTLEFVHGGAPLPGDVTGDQLAELLATGRAVADTDPVPAVPSASGTSVTRSGVGVTTPFAAPQPFLNPLDFGAKFDMRTFVSGAMTSGQTTLSVPGDLVTGYVFTSADIGKRIKVKGAGVAGASLRTTIVGVSGGNAVLGTAASTTVSGAGVIFGTDDTAALNACFRESEERTANGKANVRRVVLPTGSALFTQLEFPRRSQVEGAGWGNFGPIYELGYEFACNTLLYQFWDTNADAIVFRRATSGLDFIGPFQFEDFQVQGDPDNTSGHGIAGKGTDGVSLALQDGARFRNISADGFAQDGWHFPAGGVPGSFENCKAYKNGEYGMTYGVRGTSGGVLDLPLFSGDSNGLGLLRLLGGAGAKGTYNVRTLKSEAKANTYRTGGRQEYALVLESMGGTTVTLDGCEHIAAGTEAAAPEGLVKIIGTSVPELAWQGAYVRVSGAQTSGATLYAGQATTPVLVNDTVNSRTVGAFVSSGSFGPGGLHDRDEAPVFLPPQRLTGSVGSPALTGMSTSSVITWALDPTTDEGVAGLVELPAHWGSAAVDVHWTNLAAGAGAVVLRAQSLVRGSGDDLNGSMTGHGDLTFTAPAQNIEQVSTGWTAITLAAGKRVAFRIRRVASTGADTLPNDLGLVGVRFRRLS